MKNPIIIRSVLTFCLLCGISIFSYGQQKPVAALFGIDSTKANTNVNTTVGKPEAKPFDVPNNNAEDKNNTSTKPEATLMNTAKPK